MIMVFLLNVVRLKGAEEGAELDEGSVPLDHFEMHLISSHTMHAWMKSSKIDLFKTGLSSITSTKYDGVVKKTTLQDLLEVIPGVNNEELWNVKSQGNKNALSHLLMVQQTLLLLGWCGGLHRLQAGKQLLGEVGGAGSRTVRIHPARLRLALLTETAENFWALDFVGWRQNFMSQCSQDLLSFLLFLRLHLMIHA